MALSSGERRDIVSSTTEKLALVIGASGNAEELVSLVTQIVKAIKGLIDRCPESLKTKSTSKLAEFVFAAKKIAKDPRAVDSSSLQQLFSTKKAVETLVRELDDYYESISNQKSQDIAELESILSKPSQQHHSVVRKNSNVGDRVSPTDLPVCTEKERKIASELRSQRSSLQAKAEPQQNPAQHGKPANVLSTAMAGLQRATSELIKGAAEKAPARGSILEPTLVLARMVSMLMDLVDSLFVTKYPMRSQVHSFCCMLTDNALAYGDQSKTDDAASLRLISTQVPALMSALEVMVGQCYQRSENLRESQQMSIQRGADLHDLDVNGPGQPKSPSVRKRKEPPVPPSKKELAPPPPPKEFEVVCMICTNIAVDTTTKDILAKGSEIPLKVSEGATVGNIRKILFSRISIPTDNIQIRYRGDDVLTDDTKLTANNPLPYFVFNTCEPGEDELQDFKKKHRRGQRVRIDNADWSKLTSPIAVAIFNYESLGDDEDALEFEEGEIIEITEKSADGWWTGKIDGKVGVIPASFVEEIPIPNTKDEAKKLVKRYKQGKLGSDNSGETRTETLAAEEDARSHTSSPTPSLSSLSHNPLAAMGKALRRNQSQNSHDYSSKHGSKRGSNAEQAPKEKKDKKRGSLFKKRTTSHDPVMEYRDVPSISTEQGSPLLSTKRRPVSKIAEYTEEPKPPLSGPALRLSRPASSPKLSRLNRQTSDIKIPSSPLAPKETRPVPAADSSLKVKRRPPPPPPPFQKTYPRSNSDNNHEPDTAATFQVTPASPSTDDLFDDDLPPIKATSSMEELFRNLEEFDELAASTSTSSECSGKGGRDFATIPRSELPPVITPEPTPVSAQTSSESNELKPPQKPPRRRSKKPDPSSSPAPPPSDSIQSEPTPSDLKPSDTEDPPHERTTSSSPVPLAPPRRRSRKPNFEKQQSEEGSPPSATKASPVMKTKSIDEIPERNSSPKIAPKPARKSPLIPPKPKGLSKPVPGWHLRMEKTACSSAPVSRTGSPDDQSRLSPSTRESSLSTDLVTRSPVVMRRTNAVNASVDSEPLDDDLEDCTGIGKEGVLHKEGARKVEWKARFFRVRKGLVEYFEDSVDLNSASSLGKIPVSRMLRAVPLGEKDGFQCFAINMKYDTSVVLGCHSKEDMNDWFRSINKMMKTANSKEDDSVEHAAYETVLKCIKFLSDHVNEHKAMISVQFPDHVVADWLECVDRGQAPDLTELAEATMAADLLRSLFTKDRFGCLLNHKLSQEICEVTQSADPISVLSTKFETLSLERRDVLKQLLRLFAKVLDFSHKNHTELADLNQSFSGLLFEKLSPSQTEQLLAYLISTSEFIIS